MQEWQSKFEGLITYAETKKIYLEVWDALGNDANTQAAKKKRKKNRVQPVLIGSANARFENDHLTDDHVDYLMNGDEHNFATIPLTWTITEKKKKVKGAASGRAVPAGTVDIRLTYGAFHGAFLPTLMSCVCCNYVGTTSIMCADG